MADLMTLVHSLPAEIFNEIRDLVFTSDTSEITLTLDYKPPPQLQVCRLLRDDFATDYFKNTSFKCDHYMKPLVRKWLYALPNQHSSLIRTIAVKCFGKMSEFGTIMAVSEVIHYKPVEIMTRRAFLVHSDGTIEVVYRPWPDWYVW